MIIRKAKLVGFSLIELMVVIAIVAVLAVIAVPNYKNYTIRAKMASVMPIFDKIKNNQMATYDTTGAYSFTNTWVSENFGEVFGAYGIWSSGSSPTTAYIQVSLLDGLYPGQNPSSAGGVWVIMKIVANPNGTFSVICGYDSRSTYQIPAIYLPAACQDNIVSTG